MLAISRVRSWSPSALAGKYWLLWRTTLRQVLITPPHSVRASFHRA